MRYILRIVIIGDQLTSIEILEKMLVTIHGDIIIAGSTEDGNRGIELINSLRPDLVFIDIAHSDILSFHLLEKTKYKNFKVAFMHVSDQYAFQAIKNNAFAYLIKPLAFDDIKQCIDKCLFDSRKYNLGNRAQIEIAVADGILYIKQQKIIHVEAQGSYCAIHMNTGEKHMASKNLKYMESLLNPSIFFRCHQSHIINVYEVDKIVTTNGSFAKLSNKKLVDISKHLKSSLLTTLKYI